ncbi:hypothetical protein NO136_20980, partial [Clostridioides difficile]|nr:hypothetical protein [Clostridioides difficile]
DGQGYRFSNRDADQPRQEGYENRAEALELIARAAYYRASDIHFLLRGQHAIVQLTVNNDLRHFREYQQE